MKRETHQQGFIKYIVMFILLGVLITTFNIDMKKIVESDAMKMAAEGAHAAVQLGVGFINQYRAIDDTESATTTKDLADVISEVVQ